MKKILLVAFIIFLILIILFIFSASILSSKSDNYIYKEEDNENNMQ